VENKKFDSAMSLILGIILRIIKHYIWLADTKYIVAQKTFNQSGIIKEDII